MGRLGIEKFNSEEQKIIGIIEEEKIGDCSHSLIIEEEKRGDNLLNNRSNNDSNDNSNNRSDKAN